MRTWAVLVVARPAARSAAAGRDAPAEGDLVQAAFGDLEITAIDDNAPDAWRVFFHTAEARDRAAEALRGRFPGLDLTSVDQPDEDWAARSQAQLKAIRVGGIIVAPPWDAGSAEALPHNPETPQRSDLVVQTSGRVQPSQQVQPSAAVQPSDRRQPADVVQPPADVVAQPFSAASTVLIEPSMGFGTGHHATTRLCLAHLQELALRGRTVLDAGTGSGVLAIAAARLGAAQVLAIDDDPDAIESARRNVALNPGVEVTLGLVDLRRASLRPFDVVLANLTGSLLTATAGALQRLAAPGGRLILGGFLTHEEVDVLGAFASWAIERRSEEDAWLCITLARAA